MSIPRASVPEPKGGEHVALLMGPFDPPTMDHVRAIEALLKQDGVNHVWICPLASSPETGRVKDMCVALCMELMFTGKRASICTIALDKGWKDPQLLVNWFKKSRPDLGMRPAYVAPSDPVIEAENSIAVVVGSPLEVPLGTTVVPMPSYVPVRKDIRESIGAGHDEARNLPKSVWAYVQKNRLYR